jgi:hypothetical protein
MRLGPLGYHDTVSVSSPVRTRGRVPYTYCTRTYRRWVLKRNEWPRRSAAAATTAGSPQRRRRPASTLAYYCRVHIARLSVTKRTARSTVRSPLETGGSGGTGGGGDGDGAGTGQPPPEPTEGGDVPAFLEYLVYLVVALVAIAVVWYLLANRREAVRLIAVGLVILAVVLGLAYAIMVLGGVPLGEQPVEEPANESDGALEEGGEPGEGEGDSQLSIPTGPLLGILALLTAVFVGGLFLSRDENGTTTGTEPMPENATVTGSDAVAVGSAAGRAADRIDDGTAVENEIYRAWREMTDPLDVDRPETSTPREFAGAAVDAGLERDDVEELTRLFEDVRYGDVEATEGMEARAVSVLRRVEAAYADGTDASASATDRPSGDGGDSA